MSEPMSDTQIAEIRQHAEERPFLSFGEPLDMEERVRVRLAFQERWQLLAEVERLRAEVAAMRPIVEAVVTQGVYFTLINGRKCYFCDAVTEEFTGEPPHSPECPVLQAQALLADNK